MDLKKNRGRPGRPANIIDKAAKTLPLRPGDRLMMREIAAELRTEGIHTAQQLRERLRDCGWAHDTVS